MNGYSLTGFLFMVPKEKNRQCTCNFFFFLGGGGGGGGQTRCIVGHAQMANFV